MPEKMDIDTANQIRKEAATLTMEVAKGLEHLKRFLDDNYEAFDSRYSVIDEEVLLDDASKYIKLARSFEKPYVLIAREL